MGGYVKLCIRDTEDKLHKMEVYTSFLTYAVLDHEILLKKQEGVDRLVKQANSIYNENNDVFTSAPVDYGLVYVDLIKSVVISNQSYDYLKNLSSLSISRFSECELRYFAKHGSNNDFVNQFINLYNNNFINDSVTLYNFDKEEQVEYFFKADNLSDFLVELKYLQSEHNCLSIPVKITEHYEYYNHNTFDINCYKQIKKQIRSLGVVFTKEDEFEWLEWFERIEKYD